MLEEPWAERWGRSRGVNIQQSASPARHGDKSRRRRWLGRAESRGRAGNGGLSWEPPSAGEPHPHPRGIASGGRATSHGTSPRLGRLLAQVGCFFLTQLLVSTLPTTPPKIRF